VILIALFLGMNSTRSVSDAKQPDGSDELLKVGWMSSGRKVIPGSVTSAGRWKNEGQISLAGHEYEAIQLLVQAQKDIKNISVKFSPLKRQDGEGVIAAEHITLGLVETVLVEGKPWPDPIVPYKAFDLASGQLQPVWVCVYVPKDTSAGVYTSQVTIRADGQEPITQKLVVKVWSFTLPVTGSLKTLACWDFNPAYRAEILKHRHNPGGTITGVGEMAGPRCVLTREGKVRFEWAEYDREMQTYFDQGLTCFALPWSAGDGTGLVPFRMEYPCFDETTGKEIRLSLNPLTGSLEEARTIEWFRQFTGHLRQKGWLDKAVVYLWDEPGPKHNQEILTLGAVIKKADPGLKIFLTEWPVDELFPVVDIFCTHVVNFRDQHLPVMRKAQAKGKELWWYSCSPNPYPAPTYAIPYDNLILRTMSWLTWKFELPGSVYWSFTFNRDKDPYTVPGADGKGDGRLVYPYKDGKPVISVRLEMLRDGIEDYEYLAILKKQISTAKTCGVNSNLVQSASALLKVPSAIAISADKYTTDPDVLEKQRAKIADMIEKLNESSTKTRINPSSS
jgi:hypothetical protein